MNRLIINIDYSNRNRCLSLKSSNLAKCSLQFTTWCLKHDFCAHHVQYEASEKFIILFQIWPCLQLNLKHFYPDNLWIKWCLWKKKNYKNLLKQQEFIAVYELKHRNWVLWWNVVIEFIKNSGIPKWIKRICLINKKNSKKINQ